MDFSPGEGAAQSREIDAASTTRLPMAMLPATVMLFGVAAPRRTAMTERLSYLATLAGLCLFVLMLMDIAA